jgi:hypothetical protein
LENIGNKYNDYSTLASANGIDDSICFFTWGTDELDNASVGAVNFPNGGRDVTRSRILELAGRTMSKVSSRLALFRYDDATKDIDKRGHKRRQDCTSEKVQW